jgi:hypothetical protein
MTEIEVKIFDRMQNYLPEKDLIIKSKCYTFASIIQTHKSYASQLTHADKGTRIYECYLRRCYDWLVLLKQNNINLIKTP